MYSHFWRSQIKIKKLVDIWERGNTFPAAMLSGFKQKLESPASGKISPSNAAEAVDIIYLERISNPDTSSCPVDDTRRNTTKGLC
jgi:hypothetical protein